MANYALPSNATAHSAGLGAPNPQRLALDNLIRRELKVGDPADPKQVAQALLERYKGDPRANAIAQESRGLPFLQTAVIAPVTPAAPTSSAAEWQQACDDVERDLACLATDAILKDVMPELRGWAQAIRSTLQEGYNAARFALDPHSRDKAFAMRRQLNDYARLSRLVGTHTPTMNSYYRSLGKSLDEAANLLLVVMGEALANIGFGGGRYLPQVPYTDMQTRRDAAIYALRNLVGSTQTANASGDWPRGLDAYRQLNQLLEAQGQNDLRSLLVEGELARTMDELVQRSSDATSDGLRAVGSTALLALERFRRLVAVGRRGVSPESPTLYAFLEALQLFADGFESAGGFRLMKIARPPILFYGLYGSTGMDDADRRLIDMITRRGLLADQLDCLGSGGCCNASPATAALLDKVLYDVDRAIDLYALGATNFGQTERRAASYGYLIDAVIDALPRHPTNPALLDPAIDPSGQLQVGLVQIATSDLRPPIVTSQDIAFQTVVDNLLTSANNALTIMAAQSLADTQGLGAERAALQAERTAGTVQLGSATDLYRAIELTETHVLLPAGVEVQDDIETDGYLGVLEQELCLQGEMEARWSNLVHAMVPNCTLLDATLGTLQTVVSSAMQAMVGDTCRAQSIDLPPTLETSFDSLIDRVERTGFNRPNRAIAFQRRR
ncbi:MAG: hypothetical protein AB1430_23465 [Pseudomonadota bacterium]